MKFFQTVNKTYLALILFAVLIAAFYGNTLFNGFVLDDLAQVERNTNLRSLENLPKVFTSCIWESANQGCYGRTFYYRPAHFLSNFLTYQIFSAAWIFHLVNLLYAFTLAALIFLLAQKLTKDYLASLLAVIIFIAHPINTEVVNFVSAVPDLLYGIFAVLGALFYIRYRGKKSSKNLIAVYGFYALGVLSKEPAILMPVIFVLLDLFFFQIPFRKLVHIAELRKYLVFPAIVLLYLFARNAVLGVGPQLGALSIPERLHALFLLFGQYAGKLFFPYPLALYHSFEGGSNFLSVSFLIPFFVSVAFGAFFVYAFRKKQWLYVFGLAWFAAFLSPVLILLGGLGENVLSERYMFVPTIGFALMAGTAFAFVLRHPKIPKGTVIGVLAFFLVVSWVVVAQRNAEWRDNVTLYAKTLEQSPSAHIVRRELGEIYANQGEFEKAKAEFEYLIEKAPDWKDITMAYKGLGDYYTASGELDKALAYYTKAAETGHAPRDHVSYNNAAMLYMEKGNYLKGFAYFCQSLQLLPERNPALDSFNAALSVIESQYIEKDMLRRKIREELEKSLDEKIVYQDKRCDEKSCQYAFSFQAQQFEALPPFLITAATASAKELEITNKGFNPETGIIILELDSQYQDQPISFLFPTCQGRYYEVSSK